MFWASQAPSHSALLKGTNHRSGGLEPALRHHTGNGEAALELDTAPVLRGHIIGDEEPAIASPAYISILAALTQKLNEVCLRVSHSPKTSQLSEALHSRSLIGYSLILRHDTI